MILYGPWVSDPKTATAFGFGYNDVSWANEGMGPFAYGLAAGTFGSPARFVDGGEAYGARTATDFANIKAWQKTGLANSSALIPATHWSRPRRSPRCSAPPSPPRTPTYGSTPRPTSGAPRNQANPPSRSPISTRWPR